MGKISSFLDKHGFSFKSYGIAFILFAPAAIIISWKIPKISVGTRLILTLLTAIPLLFPIVAGGFVIQWVQSIL
jgi:hypothetical protein